MTGNQTSKVALALGNNTPVGANTNIRGSSVNKSSQNAPGTSKSRTKNNFEIKQILKMNVHHHKMNS